MKFLKPDLKKVIIFIVLVAFSIIIPVLILGTSNFYFVIVGQSMAPEYNSQDRVFIKKTTFDDLKVDDVIVFSTKQGTNIIGRIASIDHGKGMFTAKQDAEENPFEYETGLPSDSVKGKVLRKTPYLFDLLYGNFLIRLVILYLLSCFISLAIRKKNL